MPKTTISTQTLADLRLLGVPSNATLAELKQAYQIAALKHHPDRNQSNEVHAEIKRQELSHAYHRLKEFFANQALQPATLNTRDELIGLNNPSKLEFEQGIKLDEEYTFYTVFPFIIPILHCEPYDFHCNANKAQRRYHHQTLFSSLATAQEDLIYSQSKISETHAGWRKDFYYRLQDKNYLPAGIIYQFHGCAPVMIQCFTRGGINGLIPLMTGYCQQKLNQFTPSQQEQLTIVNHCKATERGFRQLSGTEFEAHQALMRLESSLEYPKLTECDFITGDISIDVIQAILAETNVKLVKPMPAVGNSSGFFQQTMDKGSVSSSTETILRYN